MARDITKFELGLSEFSQRFDGFPPYDWLRKKVVGSDSPNFVFADYRQVNVMPPLFDKQQEELNDWPVLKADPEAGFLKSRHKLATILAVANAALAEIHYENTRPSDLLPAVAYIHKNKAHAGLLPEGFCEIRTESGLVHAVAMRQGSREFRASIGFVQDEHFFYTPRGVYEVESDVPIEQLTQNYPGVPLA